MTGERCRNEYVRAFTFLELMAVMLIISILAAAIFPAARRLRQNALRARASSEAACLAQAISAYRLSLGVWPCQTQNAVDTTWTTNAHIMRALCDNPRKEVFMETPACSQAGGEFLDPWGRSYLAAMDENADGVVALQASLSGLMFCTNVRGSAAVASWGPDPSDPRLRIIASAP